MSQTLPDLAEAPAAAPHLQRLISQDVFERLARGFVDGRRRRGGPEETEESLGEVFQGTLRLLCRLLFVMHAEARGILPTAEPGYAAQSLARIRRRVAEAVDGGKRLSGATTELWGDLTRLFDLLGRGGAEAGVPGLGGPFAPDGDGFLRDNSVADSFLHHALDHLSRNGERRFIDHGALGAAEVAGVCEGLLALRLVPGPQGKPSLVGEKGERKSVSGSPHPSGAMVEYAVAETVGPALEARAAAFRAAMEEIGALRERAEQASGDERTRLEGEIAALADRAADSLLDLRVCDPAMGSGRFLAAAVDLAAGRLAALLADHPQNPVSLRLDALRRGIADGLAAQGISADTSRLDDAALLRRLVARRCIYGVDVHPLAAELARLALWLQSLVPGAPLPFLDHHLRCGNALVGARVAEVQRAVEASPEGQLNAFGGPFRDLLRATRPARDLASIGDATAEETAAAARAHAELRREMAPYRRLLDVWVSRGFGNRPGAELAAVRGEEVLRATRGGSASLSAAGREALARADALAAEHRFFHWELELPDAFVDLERGAWMEDPGFDAVIGAPPRGRHEQAKALRPHLAAAFADVHDAAADLAVHFHRQGLELLRAGGRMGLVAPGRWLRAAHGQGLREALAHGARVERVVDFAPAPGAAEADALPSLVVVRRPGAGEAEGPRPAQVAVLPREAAGGASLGASVAAKAYAVPAARFGREPWSLEPSELEAVLEKIRRAGVPLGEHAAAAPIDGLRTGLNDAFVVDTAVRDRLVEEDPRSAELLRPCIRGPGAERWAPAWQGTWLVFTPRGVDIDRYPAIRRHLEAFRERLEPRPAGWAGEHWPGRRPGDQAWFELQDAAAQWPLFEQPKILWRDPLPDARFSLDAGGLYPVDHCTVLPTGDPWLLAVLNSAPLWFYMARTAPRAKDDSLRLGAAYVEALPIAPAGDPAPAEAAAAVERLVELTRDRTALEREMVDWLWAELSVAPPPEAARRFADLAAEDFVEEVRAHRPRKAPPLTPRQLAAIRNAHAGYAPRLRTMEGVAAGLERKLAHLVNRAYGLTPGEVELISRTTPQRTATGK